MGDDRQATSVRGQRGVRRFAWRVLVVVVLIVSLPAIALANHQFTDVPTSSPFHTNIARLVGSGITAGCGSGKYCPKASVTREQMAAFLSRGLGRTALGTGEITFEEADEFYVAVVDIDTGGTSRAGLGFININATVTLFTDIPGLCPCSGIAYLLDDATNTLVGSPSAFTVSDDAPDLMRAGNANVNAVVRTPSGVSGRYGLVLDVRTTGTPPGPGAPGATLHGSMTADYFPFGSSGGSTVGTVESLDPPFQPEEPLDRRTKPES